LVANVGCRREAGAAVRSSGGPLTDLIPAAHPLGREPLKMPQTGPSAARSCDRSNKASSALARGRVCAFEFTGRTSMTNSRFNAALYLLPIFGALILAATSWAQQRPSIADKMAKTHGLDSFGQVEGIRYTFNVERPGVNVSRSWEWNPKTDSVSYEG